MIADLKFVTGDAVAVNLGPPNGRKRGEVLWPILDSKDLSAEPRYRIDFPDGSYCLVYETDLSPAPKQEALF